MNEMFIKIATAFLKKKKKSEHPKDVPGFGFQNS